MKSYEALFQASLYLETTEWTPNTLAELPTCKGVLLFADAAGHPIQLLQAVNCRRTAQARLLQDEDQALTRKKADVSQLTKAIHYTGCYNNFLSQLTYTQLARGVFGNDAKDWIQLPKISLAAIDTDAFLPYFYVTDTADEDPNQQRFGLFPSRKAAADFCESLNTVFVLCRNPALLKTGKEPSCPYLQMQTCPGPCLDENLMGAYAAAVNQALKTAAGNIEKTQQELQEQMQQASEEMRFEKAHRCKKKLERLTKLTGTDFQFIHPLHDACFLHIDIGPKQKPEGGTKKVQQFMWFKVTTRNIYHIGTCTPTTEEEVKRFIETNWSNDQDPLPTKNCRERLSLLSLHLFRSQRPGVWLDCSKGIWLEEVVSELKAGFGLNFNPGA